MVSHIVFRRGKSWGGIVRSQSRRLSGLEGRLVMSGVREVDSGVSSLDG